MEEIGLKAVEHSSVLMPVLLESIKDRDPLAAKQSIISGTNIFCHVLEEITLQFRQHGTVERWLEDLWVYMVKFKDTVFASVFEPGPVGLKLLAVKFLERFILLFTSESEGSINEGNGRAFNLSLLIGGHPNLDLVAFTSEAKRIFGVLLDLLQSASNLPGPLTISIINCLAAIARKRTQYYGTVLSALLDFDPHLEFVKGGHAASIQYSLRTAFLGFLRCTHPAILESRDRLVRALRAVNAGEAADQAIRKVEKMIKSSERASRDVQLGKDDQSSSQPPVAGDLPRKRPLLQDNGEPVNGQEVASKCLRYGPNTPLSSSVQTSGSGQDHVSLNGVPSKVPRLDNGTNPVEAMIEMIGALLAEGERGAGSLEILISNMHPDMLADIVIANMRHLPKISPPLLKVVSFPVGQQISLSVAPAQAVAPTAPVHFPPPSAELPASSTVMSSTSLSDMSTVGNSTVDAKRDPRKDPRRFDPRHVIGPVGVPALPCSEDTGRVQSEIDKNPSLPPVIISENFPLCPISTSSIDVKNIGHPLVPGDHIPTSREDLQDEAKENISTMEVAAISDVTFSRTCRMEEDSARLKTLDMRVTEEADALSPTESNQICPSVPSILVAEETCQDLSLVPSYVDLTEEQQGLMTKLAVERIIEYRRAPCSQTRMTLLARLVSQVDVDNDVLLMLQKRIILDYQNQKGHELALHILYHLHAVMSLDSAEFSPSAAQTYEKFLMAVAKSLLDTFPASDKSFSRLLGEAPFLPNSVLQLLDDLCYSDVIDDHGNEIRDVDRVTQGLGAVWSLILGRPQKRQACLNIALKCAVHSQDEIRTKAIRLVANKLYQLLYISEPIELYATNMLYSAVDEESSQERQTETTNSGKVEGEETPIKAAPNLQSSHRAQCLIPLFFSLCTKKPKLLLTVFQIYGKAPKTVKQAVHRHIPTLIRALGSSYSDLLPIISDPPQGSENLLTQVLKVLTEGITPTADLIATVKYLYQTKLKDVAILVPMLSSLSKDEVLPIFPRLADLPLERFQDALARILQGSAHTGPALSPAEVLVAIHDIVPERDGVPLKKIMEACSACFEQRTVFTQQVLEKALSEMVDRTPLPLLFMRTVIQAIDAYPTLVDFVMEMLSKLVSKQVWRMPKLWVGFLKCVAQTQPHSFPVLLQLPHPQLESALNKHPNLRGPLAAYARQPSIRSSIPRPTLVALGLASDTHAQQAHHTPLHSSSEVGSAVRGAALI